VARGFASIPEAIEDIRQGKAHAPSWFDDSLHLVIVVDDEQIKRKWGGPYNGSVKGNTRSYGIYCQAWDWYSVCELPLMVTHKENEENCALHLLYQWYVINFSIYII